MMGRVFQVLVGWVRCESIDRLVNCVEVFPTNDVISGGHDDDDRICVALSTGVRMERDDAVVTGHHIECDVLGSAHEIEGELVCAMIVYVVRTVGASVLLFLGHDDMVLSC